MATIVCNGCGGIYKYYDLVDLYKDSGVGTPEFKVQAHANLISGSIDSLSDTYTYPIPSGENPYTYYAVLCNDLFKKLIDNASPKEYAYSLHNAGIEYTYLEGNFGLNLSKADLPILLEWLNSKTKEPFLASDFSEAYDNLYAKMYRLKLEGSLAAAVLVLRHAYSHEALYFYESSHDWVVKYHASQAADFVSEDI